MVLSGDSDFSEGSQCRWGKERRIKKRKKTRKKKRPTRRARVKMEMQKNKQVRLSMGGGQVATHNGRLGLTTRWQIRPTRKSGQIVQNVELTYAGQTRKFAERFPVSTKSKHDSLTIPVEVLDSPGGYSMEATAWYVPAAKAGAYIKSMPVKGTVGQQWWGNAFGCKGHLDVPAAATYHRSFHMVWDGGSAEPRVVKRTGF